MVAQYLKLAGKRLVVLEEAEYLRLQKLDKTSNRNAAVLSASKRGRREAAGYILESIARSIAADRKAAGLSQQELAARAKIRQETLSRIESGKHRPTMATLKKIDRVLRINTESNVQQKRKNDRHATMHADR